jgi:tetratricopeptide (TPR) repeat protein
MGSVKEAKEHLETSLYMLHRSSQPSDWRMARIYNDLGDMLKDNPDGLDVHTDAEEMYYRAIEICQGEKEPDLESKMQLAYSYRALGNLLILKDAEHLAVLALNNYINSLRVYQESLEEDHPYIADIYKMLGILGLQTDPERFIQVSSIDKPTSKMYLEKSLIIYMKTLGSMCEEVADLHKWLGHLLYVISDWTNALENVTLSIEIYNRNVGTNSSESIEAYYWMGRILEVLYRYEEAKGSYQQILTKITSQQNVTKGGHLRGQIEWTSKCLSRLREMETTLNPKSTLEKCIDHILNKRLRVDDELLISSYANSVELDDEVGKKGRKLLWTFIALSKDEDEGHKIQIGAANAITILNYARISFSGMDFSHIKVPYADLSNIIADKTDFTGADLRYTICENAWFSEAKFINTRMDEMELRFRLLLKVTSDLRCYRISTTGSLIGSVTANKINIYTQKYELMHNITIDDHYDRFNVTEEFQRAATFEDIVFDKNDTGIFYVNKQTIQYYNFFNQVATKKWQLKLEHLVRIYITPKSYFEPDPMDLKVWICLYTSTSSTLSDCGLYCCIINRFNNISQDPHFIETINEVTVYKLIDDQFRPVFFKSLREQISSVVFSKNYFYVCLSSKIHIYSLNDFSSQRQVDIVLRRPRIAPCISSDENYLVQNYSNYCDISSLLTGALVNRIHCPDKDICYVYFSSDPNKIIIITIDNWPVNKDYTVYEIQDSFSRRSRRRHLEYDNRDLEYNLDLHDVFYLGNGERAVLLETNGTIRICNLKTSKTYGSIKKYNCRIAVSNNQKYIAIFGDIDHHANLTLYDSNGVYIKDIPFKSDHQVKNLRFDDDNIIIVRYRPAEIGKEVWYYKKNEQYVKALTVTLSDVLAYYHEKDWLLVKGDFSLKLWCQEHGYFNEFKIDGVLSNFRHATFSPCGSFIVAVYYEKRDADDQTNLDRLKSFMVIFEIKSKKIVLSMRIWEPVALKLVWLKWGTEQRVIIRYVGEYIVCWRVNIDDEDISLFLDWKTLGLPLQTINTVVRTDHISKETKMVFIDKGAVVD